MTYQQDHFLIITFGVRTIILSKRDNDNMITILSNLSHKYLQTRFRSFLRFDVALKSIITVLTVLFCNK